MNFELNGRLLKYENEEFHIWGNKGQYKKNPKWVKISICNHNQGYKYIHIEKKNYTLHRILGMLFLGLNIDNPKQHIDHIDGNRSNNELSNLRIVTNQQNQWNQVRAKGYYFHNQRNKFVAKIIKDGKTIHLGYFDIEEDAHHAYLSAKSVYHKII